MTESAEIKTQGELLWSGEHWVAYLRPPSYESESGMASPYHVQTSPVGRGTAALVKNSGKTTGSQRCERSS